MNSTIIQLDELKKQLNITDESKDDILNFWIQVTEDYVRTECRFDEGDTFPNGLKGFALLFIQFNMSSENSLLSGYKEGNVSYNYVNELPMGITNMLKPYKKHQLRYSFDK